MQDSIAESLSSDLVPRPSAHLSNEIEETARDDDGQGDHGPATPGEHYSIYERQVIEHHDYDQEDILDALTYEEWRRNLSVAKAKDENGRWRSSKLPMIHFSNERSLLDWMRVSVTLAVIAIGINFLSGSGDTSTHANGHWIITRVLSLLLLLMSIFLSSSAYFLFTRRYRFIHELRETSDVYANIWMPRFLTCVGVLLMLIVWSSTLVRLHKKK
jgi:uncharacterized membrane protein YidH (DUF202 family)